MLLEPAPCATKPSGGMHGLERGSHGVEKNRHPAEERTAALGATSRPSSDLSIQQTNAPDNSQWISVTMSS
eukprot:1016986-Pyramimonas_sp.AAC.1